MIRHTVLYLLYTLFKFEQIEWLLKRQELGACVESNAPWEKTFLNDREETQKHEYGPDGVNIEEIGRKSRTII